MFVTHRAHAGLFVTPGVNVYFGDQVALRRKDLPQRWFLPLYVHVMVPYTAEPLVGEKQAIRLAEVVQNAFQGFGGQLQVCDFSNSPPTPVSGRFVSWAREFRGDWKELGDPSSEAFTNRQWTTQVRFVR